MIYDYNTPSTEINNSFHSTPFFLQNNLESKNASPVSSLRLKFLRLQFRKALLVTQTLENMLISKHTLYLKQQR